MSDKPRRTAFVMANNAQVLETNCGPAELIVFDLAYVTRVHPGTELCLQKGIGGQLFARGMRKSQTFKTTFEAVVHVHPQMMVGWSREAIKEELCRRLDDILDSAAISEALE